MIFSRSHIFLAFYSQHLLLCCKQENVQLKRATVTQQSPGLPLKEARLIVKGN